MKEQQTIRRFDAIAALAVVGCAGMLLFESFFIFEVYQQDFLQKIPVLFGWFSSEKEPAVESPQSFVPASLPMDGSFTNTPAADAVPVG